MVGTRNSDHLKYYDKRAFGNAVDLIPRNQADDDEERQQVKATIRVNVLRTAFGITFSGFLSPPA